MVGKPAFYGSIAYIFQELLLEFWGVDILKSYKVGPYHLEMEL